ncbi:MAG: hypothetical protein MR431_04250 [Clostridia bacterium]|nr:hypothetical protein [Clostridia bacterium]MDD7671952.1 hypothetical protein [Clostridia bacterium]MDY2929136.1 hypothetical protein [Clostridiaceae bacterium]
MSSSVPRYTTPIPALVKLAAALLLDDALCSRESISITRDGGGEISARLGCAA